MKRIPTQFINALAVITVLCSIMAFTQVRAGAAEASINAANYVSLSKTAATDLSDIMNQLQTTNQSIIDNPYLVQDPYTLAQIGILWGRIDGIAVVFKGIKPPKGFEGVHKEFLAALDDYHSASDYYIRGVIGLDGNLISQATTYMTSANDHINEATRLLKEK